MRVFRSLSHLPSFKNAVITIGTFDGVHQGHQQIIKRINTLAQEYEGESIIVTFDPHPRLVINPADSSLKLLNTLDEKIFLLKKYGVHNVVITPFSRSFSEQSAEDYIEFFLVRNFRPKFIVIGYDHRFGKNRSGDIQLLKNLRYRFGYEVEEIPKATLDAITISSTKIRHALAEGNIKIANELLGHYYSLEGIVTKGLQNGKKIGYPTANIHIADPNKLIPRTGVYAVLVHYGENIFGGMLNIGYNPTFGGKTLSVEVNILDFNKDIYGEKIKVELVDFVREEIKFANIELLVEAIHNDKKNIEKILASVLHANN
ncbi:MAG: bifunctional riboflavin kinase/FAD synthetase [Chitinophagales bacterium]|nr:bifunctional riboflavin kinase/FAD synthetase [Chitinophagales bacterium]MDW8273493.1 bifunctional riboflavin kinase/FAD synthetase [Chitinophagales bacterium]